MQIHAFHLGVFIDRNMRVLLCISLLLFAQQISGKSPYFSKETQEIDSSEHGGPPGRKGTTCGCGWANKASKRIVGGEETKVNEFPFAVALINHYRQVFCGGSIITPYHVLTAGHCTVKFIKRGMWMAAAVGEHDITKTGETKYTQVIPVRKMLQHENYDDNKLWNDISVLLLDREMKFNQFVGPVCLSLTRLNIEKQYVKLVGWGKTAHGGQGSNVLKKINLRVVPLDVCAKNYNSFVYPENRTQICAHSLDQGSCQGDSGGPLVWLDPETNRYTQAGIVSFGRICGSLDPSVYTDPTAYIGWIQDRVRESTPAGASAQICSKK